MPLTISERAFMKNLFNARVPSFDAKAINETIARALASAGLDTTSGPMRSVTETIRRTLASGRISGSPRVVVKLW